MWPVPESGREWDPRKCRDGASQPSWPVATPPTSYLLLLSILPNSPHGLPEMQEEVQRRLSGPDPTRGYYYDDATRKYFPVPRPGTMGYPMYNELKTRVETEVTAELASKATVKKKRKRDSLYHAVCELRSGYALNRPSEVKLILEKASIRHHNATKPIESEIAFGGKARLLHAPTQPDSLIIAGNSTLSFYSTLNMTQDEPVDHRFGEDVDLRCHAENGLLSASTLSGHLRLHSLTDLTMQRDIEFQSSIWSHEWLTSKDVFCGGDSQGTIIDIRFLKWTKVHSEKSSIFAITTLKDTENDLLFGTRAGKLFRLDRRKKSSFRLNLIDKDSKKEPYCDLMALKGSNYVIGGHIDGTIQLIDLRMLAPVMTWKTGLAKIENKSRISISDDQSLLAVADKEAVVRIFDISLPTDEALAEVPFTAPVMDIIWSKSWTKRRVHGFGVASGTGLSVVQVPFV